ncbi:MAG: hypothetical protein E7422_11440, partial [Ruminococcaceae bacterium]|nr:hypothetical protein [Oscillospiraceae bacterium]
MESMISELFHGGLHPNEKSYRHNAHMELLLESFAQNETWLTEHLDGKAKEHLLELVNIHDELDGAVSFGSFREGFIIGASLVMEA